MSNALKYIKSLEAAGFARAQAEAQVQMVLDVLEGDLVTKSDLALVLEKIDARFAKVDARFAELELKLVSRLGALIVTCTTLIIGVMTWLIKTT